VRIVKGGSTPPQARRRNPKGSFPGPPDALTDDYDAPASTAHRAPIGRLARSVVDLQDIVRALKEKGAALKATEQPIDTSNAAGKAFFDRLGVFAEFGTNLRRERLLEGIAKANARGDYKVIQETSPTPKKSSC
jgi:hypothetical protein